MADAALSVTLQARFAQFEKQLDRVANQTDAKLARVEKRVAQTNKSLNKGLNFNPSVKGAMGLASALGTAAGAAAALIAALGVGKVLQIADEYTRYTNQLKLAGLEGEALKRTEAALLGIAQENGTELAGLGTLYGRLAQSKKELGATDAQLIQFTDGVSAALRIQGGDAQSASGALLQLSQAVGGAVVRAEEFNSINEGARPILEAVANGSERFAGSVTKLREEVLKGTVTSKEFFDAFLKGTPALKEKAAGAALTLSQSLTTLKNALMATVGEAVAQTGATEDLADAIKVLADNMDVLVPAIVAVMKATGAAAKGFADFVQNTRDAYDGTKELLAPMGDLLNMVQALTQIGQINIVIRALGLDDEMRKLREYIGLLNLATPQGQLGFLAKGARNRGRQARLIRESTVTPEQMRELVGGRPAAAPTASRAATAGGSRGGRSGGGRSGPSAADLEAKEAERLQRVADQTYRAKMDALEAEVGFARSMQDRQEFAQILLEMEHQQERVLLERQLAEKEINQAEFDRLKSILERKQAAETQSIRDKQAIEIADGRREAEQMHLDAEMELLRLASSNAETSKERRAIELRILDLAYQEERSRLERIAADQQLTDYQRQAAQAALAGLDARKAAATQGVINDTRSPIEQFQKDAQITTDSLEELAVRGMRSLNEALLDAITNSENAGEAIRNVFLNLLRDLALQQMNAAAANFLGAIKLPGFASGTNFAPGGAAIVGEKGPELVNLPRGSQVVPNNLLRALPGAMSAGRAPAPVINDNRTFHLAANGDPQIFRMMKVFADGAYNKSMRDGGRAQPGFARAHRQLEA